MILSAGIDALTITMDNVTDEAQWLLSYVQKKIHEESEAGNDVKFIKAQQFEGIRAGHYRWGDNGKRLLFEIKGHDADEFAQIIKDSRAAGKVTRIDWEVTHRQTQEAEVYTGHLRGAFKRASQMSGRMAPSKSRLYESVDGADSFYIHTADNEFTYRAYNKHAESPDCWPKMTWRHELQLRHERARQSWEMFKSAASSEVLAKSHVIGHLMTIGHTEEWFMDTEPCRALRKREASDTEKRIAWFETTAVPVLKKLVRSGVDVVKLMQPIEDEGLTIVAKRNKKALKSSQNLGGQ